MKRKVVRYVFLLLSVAGMGAIFYLSAQDGQESGALSGWWAQAVQNAFQAINLPIVGEFLVEHIRKCAHVLLYAFLGLCVSVCAFTFPAKQKWLYIAIPVAICLFYACSDEFHQLFVSGREGKITDVLIDSIGFLTTIIFANLVWLLINRHKDKERRQSDDEI